MKITVYATRIAESPETLAVLGYPVSYSLEPTPDAVKLTLDLPEGSKVYEKDGDVWIEAGTNPGILRTFDQQPTITIHTYNGDVNTSLRILSIEK